MSKKDFDFYKRMLEAKALKKKRLEQEQLLAEFQVHPERFNDQPIIRKTVSEEKLDNAFSELKEKLYNEHPLTQSERIQQEMQRIQQKMQGL